MDKNYWHGGPAFPRPGFEDENVDILGAQEGMTLLDYTTIKIAAAMLATGDYNVGWSPHEMAALALAQAVAILDVLKQARKDKEQV